MSKNKRVLFITGGTRGIGRAISLKEASSESLFFINYLRDDDTALKTKKEIEEKGGEVHLIPGNIGDPDFIQEAFKIIQEKTDHLDVLIHSAALGVFKPVHQLRVKDWDISLDVNAKAFLLLAQGALPLMKKNGGRMITISSLGANHFTPNYGAIGISKSALENLVRYLAVELAQYKIHVNAVSGGLIDTDSLKMFPESDTMKKEFLRRTPGGRLGKPEDIASVIHFLLSPESDWLYGQTIIADGGYSLF